MKPLVLCILDGVGIREDTHGNAVYQANMPNFKRILNECPNCLLTASGKDVGLPDGQMGNSEVGHTNIGAGRIVYQPLELINKKIETKEFFDNEKIKQIINYTKENKSKLHIMGLLSDGGIHSHINHLFALLEMCKKEGVDEVYLHMFMDGRDTLPCIGLSYLDMLNDKINELGIGEICTISGRYYAMDRDNNYDRLEKAYDVIVYAKGPKYKNYKEAIKANNDAGITDEFTVPCLINKDGVVNNKDGVIFFNFRPDRLRELGSSLTNKEFNAFPHKKLNIKLYTMMPISDEAIYTPIFDLEQLDNTFGEYISKNGLTQLRIAETEKYAHVTYFFDGGVEKKLKGEKRKLISSPKVATYDLKPEMSALKITDYLVKQIENFDVVILNFANGDMVGHTGNLEQAVKGLECVDKCLGNILSRVKEIGGTVIVTADHGNCEYMLDKNNNVLTTHTTNPVPFIIVTDDDIELTDGKLSDIAPTMLYMLNLPIPEEMTGNVLIKNKPKKEHKKGNLFEKIFAIVSIIFLSSMILIYGGRFIYYYHASHNTVKYQETNILTKLNSEEVKASQSGVYDDGTSRYYKGLVDNNYLYYKGLEWRIVNFNNNQISLMSEESLTNIPYDMVTSFVDNLKKQYKDDKYIKDISLMSSDEYSKTLLGDSYLNNNTSWYTSDNKYIDSDGKVKDNIDNSYSVRIMIKISTDAIIISGDGILINSYTVEKDKPIYLKDVNIGSYVKFSNKLWRVIKIDDTGVKLALEDLLDSHIYSKSNDTFNMEDNTSLAYYLNNDFYKTLKTNDIKMASWDIGVYNKKYSIKKKVEANVGLLELGDLFINDQSGYILSTEETDKTVYKVIPKGLIYIDYKTSKNKVRPSLYIDSSLLISGGQGYKNSPYEIGE